MWVTPEQLDQLRFILYTGIGYGLILLILINLPPDWGQKKAPPATQFCQLHKRPVAECADLHTKEKP